MDATVAMLLLIAVISTIAALSKDDTPSSPLSSVLLMAPLHCGVYYTGGAE